MQNGEEIFTNANGPGDVKFYDESKISDISPSLEDINLLNNGGIPSNRIIFQEHAVSGNQVLYEFAI